VAPFSDTLPKKHQAERGEKRHFALYFAHHDAVSFIAWQVKRVSVLRLQGKDRYV
jgi:hypothetical protein